MKCRFCGKDLPEDELICPNCGQEVQEPEEVDSEEIDKEIEQEKSKKEPKKIGLVKKIALIAAAVVIGLAAGVGLATLVFGGPTPTAGKVDYAQSNLNNGGRFAFADGAIYYIAQDDAADEEGNSSTATCIIKQAGEEKEKILSMDQLSYLNIYQGRMYFKQIEDKESIVYSADLNGGDLQELFRAGRALLNLTVCNDKIYYLMDGELISTDLSGQNQQTIISEGVENFCVFDRYLYYSDDSKTYVLQNGRQQELFDSPSRSFLPYGEYVYFINIDGGLARMSITGGSPVTLSEEDIGNFTIWDDKIYYTRQLPQDEVEQMAGVLHQYDLQKEQETGETSNRGEMHYRMLLIGSGPLHKMDLNGENVEAIEGKDITRALFGDEEQIYYTIVSQGEPYPVEE